VVVPCLKMQVGVYWLKYVIQLMRKRIFQKRSSEYVKEGIVTGYGKQTVHGHEVDQDCLRTGA